MCPDGILPVKARGLCYGGGQDCNIEKEGFVVFMRNGSDNELNESNDQRNHEYYKKIVSYLGLKASGKITLATLGTNPRLSLPQWRGRHGRTDIGLAWNASKKKRTWIWKKLWNLSTVNMLGVVLREHIHVMLVLHLNFLKHLTKQQHSNIPTLTRSWSQRGICIYAEQIITFRSIVFEGYHKKDLINHGISIPDIFTRLKQ